MKLPLPLIILQWVTALCVILTAPILFGINKLVLKFYAHALGSKPLPALTTWTSADAICWYLYPLPILLLALYALTAPADKKDFILFASVAALAFSLLVMSIVVTGTVLPAIPVWVSKME